MKALVLAAGRGLRMRPLTDDVPKPLLLVHGKPLIEWHLEALSRDGVRDVVINTAWLEAQLVAALGDGSRWGVRIEYSMEGRDHGGALETAGGIAKALPMLASAPDDRFWVVSGDIFVPGFCFGADQAQDFAACSDLLAHVWLVANPPYHPNGDFGLNTRGFALADDPGPDGQRWTYANVALCRAELFSGIAPGSKAALGPLLHAGMRHQRITAQVYTGAWANVGTPQDLWKLNAADAAS